MERHHFENELQALKNRLLEMGGLVEERVHAAVGALMRRDVGATEAIIRETAEVTEAHGNNVQRAVYYICAALDILGRTRYLFADDAVAYTRKALAVSSEDSVHAAEAALADAKKALEGTDKSAMDAARERLTQASHKLAEQMYKAAQPAAGAPAEGPQPGTNGATSKKDGGVIDAEYVDVEEKK